MNNQAFYDGYLHKHAVDASVPAPVKEDKTGTLSAASLAPAVAVGGLVGQQAGVYQNRKVQPDTNMRATRYPIMQQQLNEIGPLLRNVNMPEGGTASATNRAQAKIDADRNVVQSRKTRPLRYGAWGAVAGAATDLMRNWRSSLDKRPPISATTPGR
jgi:hypothetical protein